MTIKVLLIDDDEDDFVITKDLLQRIPNAQFDLTWASSFDSGLDSFEREPPDIALLDYRLGGQSGLDLLQVLRDRGVQTPVIVLTGLGDREVDVAAMRAGAVDYLVKSELTTQILDRAIRYALSVAALNARLDEEHKRLAQIEKLSSIGLLAASVVHEVNNPLAGVKSLVGALDDPSLPDSKRTEYLAAIKDGLNRMGETMRGLLDLARERPMALEPLDAADIATSCLQLVAASFRKSGILADQRIPAGSMVTADRSRLMQALINLLMNAADATPRGGRVTLSLRARTGYVGINVRDTGSGIPKDIATRVVEPFFTTKPTGKGTGLGLAIVSSIAKGHRGSVEIEDARGGGASITLWLPATTR